MAVLFTWNRHTNSFVEEFSVLCWFIFAILASTVQVVPQFRSASILPDELSPCLLAQVGLDKIWLANSTQIRSAENMSAYNCLNMYIQQPTSKKNSIESKYCHYCYVFVSPWSTKFVIDKWLRQSTSKFKEK